MKYLILALAILFCFGCGTRKMNLNKSSSLNQLEEKTKTSVNIVDKSVNSQVQTNTNDKDFVEEETIFEFDNPPPGQPNRIKQKRTTDRGKIKAVDERSTENDITTGGDIESSLEAKNKENNKTKNIEADTTVVTNSGGRLTLIIIVAVIGLIVAGYFYLKPK